MMTLKFEQSI
ncbi:unnamed protein product [Leptidea sinapis]|uniref:Uncharacterized protein n=1 Tax=Leptidea sinapis TaxID=189913 RepID=A0A5E4PVI2_9NEOP|nr:unnamed protein product [Leptidea sinapis]